VPLDGQEAVLVAQVARYVHHPELPRLLPVLARSGSPSVREAIALLWRHRPDVVDAPSLDALTMDPVVAVRREAAGAAAGAGAWELLGRMAEDPEADVRREVALALGGAERPSPLALATLARLGDDQEMAVRAAAYVGRLLQGTPVPLPPGLDPRAAAAAVRNAAHLPALREMARTAPGEDRRLAAALALALLEDDVARHVARTDPVPGIRHRVSGALDLAAAAREGE
jgi:HEAT repeat protein